jgi:hypothetical protein
LILAPLSGIVSPLGFRVPPPVAGPSYLVRATMSAADDTLLSAYTPEAGGTATIYNGETWKIIGGKLRMTSSPGAWRAVSWDTGVTDVDISAKVNRIGSAHCVAELVGRLVDGSNYYHVEYESDLTALVLRKFVAGSDTILATGSGPGFATGTQYDFRMTIIGTAIKVYWDGVEVISTTDNTFTTGTRVGVQTFKGGSYDSAEFDDFTVLAP